MEVNHSQRIKGVVFSTIEGVFYGFFLGIFLWSSMYLVYVLEGYYRSRNRVNEQIHIDIAPYSIDLINLSLRLMFISLFARLLIILASKCVRNTLSSWLKTGIVTFICLYLFVLIKELYFSVTVFTDWLCCLSDSVDVVLWLLIFVLTLIFSIFYAVIRNHLAKLRKVS